MQIILVRSDIKMLEWLKNNGFKIEINHDTMQMILIINNTEKLEWFKVNEFKIKVDQGTIVTLLIRECSETLKWIKNNGNKIELDELDDMMMKILLMNGDVTLLDWIVNNNVVFEIKLDNDTLRTLLKNNNLKILDWLKNNGVDFEVKCEPVLCRYLLIHKPHILKYLDKNFDAMNQKIRDFFPNQNVRLDDHNFIMNEASRSNRTDILDIYKNSGIIDNNTKINLHKDSFAIVSEWWLNSGLRYSFKSHKYLHPTK